MRRSCPLFRAVGCLDIACSNTAHTHVSLRTCMLWSRRSPGLPCGEKQRNTHTHHLSRGRNDCPLTGTMHTCVPTTQNHHRVHFLTSGFLLLFFLRFYLFIFRERGRERKREGEKHQCVVASCTPPTGGLACNPGMCPDWESNQWPFRSQASTQSTEPHQPELRFIFLPTPLPLLQIYICILTRTLDPVWQKHPLRNSIRSVMGDIFVLRKGPFWFL